MTTSEIYEPLKKSRSAWHDVRGVRYHVREWGKADAPLVVLLHGWGDASASFQFMVDNLVNDWFVVAPDWRGFGLSRNRTHSYWFPDYVADLDVLLSIYQPKRPVFLLGHSMGANAAGLYAGVFPERVRGFVNVEGFGLADRDPEKAPENYRGWIESSRSLRGYQTYSGYDELAARIIKRAPATSVDKAQFVARNWASEEGGHIVLHADPAHKLPNAVLYRRAEASACWGRVEAEVLLVLGEETEFRADMKAWLDPDESRHPFRGARTEVVAGAGHMIHIEKPGELARITEAFLGDLV